MSPDVSQARDRMQQFVSLLTAHQSSIYAFILSRVPRSSEADDLMQETSATMWQKFDTFEIGTDFQAWGMQIARYHILNFTRKQKHGEVHFSEETLMALDAASGQGRLQSEDMTDVLTQCIGRLPSHLANLLVLRYSKEVAVKSIASRIGKSIPYVYKTLAKTHDLLLRCIRRTFVTR